MLTARRYLVRGRVQGVGFRYFTQRAAHVEGVHGWVRNTEDGHVEIAAEGDRDALDRFELSVRRGPVGARVADVTVDEAQPTCRVPGFTIRS